MFMEILRIAAKVYLFIYDVVTYPIYQLVFKMTSKQRVKDTTTPRPYMVKESSEEIIWRRDVSNEKAIYKEIIIDNKVDTLTKAFNFAVDKYGEKEFLGTREVLGEEDEVQKDGKVFKKLSLGNYKWITFNDTYSLSINFGKGLLELGQQPEDSIVIYAETRAEWIMAAFGAFSQSLVVATMYTNLGDEAIIHGLNETGVTLVVTSHDLLPKFQTFLAHCPKINTIVVMEDQIFPTETSGYKSGVKIIYFKSVVKLGETSTIPTVAPSSVSPAIIMYTSGSTGVPKGVVLTHGNLISTTTCIMFMEPFYPEDVYIAYLPLAHVLELLSECTMMLFGGPVGYSSPNTMTDLSTKVKKGQKGDASILKPTIMCVVPLILDRIYKNIIDKVNQRGIHFQNAFNFFYQYKLYWTKNNQTTPILDKILFNKFKALLGGRMRFAITGGAPLSPETHQFIRVCLGLILVQGYSLTETTCTGTCMESEDKSTGYVGAPMAGMEMKMVNWEEGNYRVTDKPRPRGEIIIGGSSVAKGYFKNDEKTKQEFYDEGGKRWFRTGDIGELYDNGGLKIIDRKKDLVKLQLGEYVSLGKVEAQLKTHPLVDNICVDGDPYQSSTVAVVVPIRNTMEKLALDLGKTFSDYEDLCKDKDIVQAVLKSLTAHAIKTNLKKFEIPRNVSLVPNAWTPETGLVTAAFKIKRKVVKDMFKEDIEKMYKDTS